jgi:cell shape-determining protein MreD
MATLLSIPLFTLLIILQTAIASRLPLLYGMTDLGLLVVIAWALQERVRNAWAWSLVAGLVFGYATALPTGIPLAGYLAVTGLALLVKQRIWQIPLLAMLAITFLGTLITQGAAALSLSLRGIFLPWLDVINLIILPSLLLNLILAVPIFFGVRDLAGWLYPEEIEIA